FTSRKNRSSMGGTKCKVVMNFFSMILSKTLGSLCTSGGAMTNRAPIDRGQKNSHTDTSKVKGVFCKTQSLWVKSYSDCIQRIRFAIAAWLTATPFGAPVEPDVKIM